MDFIFQRIKWDAYSAGKSSCKFCDLVSVIFFTKEGFARHCTAKHPHAQRSELEDDWKNCRNELKVQMLSETEDFLNKLSKFNKSKTGHQEFVVSCDNDKASLTKQVWAASAEMAVKTFAVYLDAALVLSHTTSEPVLVKCHSLDFDYDFHLWKGLSGGYIAKCCLTKASTASLPLTSAASFDLRGSSGMTSYAEGDVVLSTLQQVFGFADFKPGQRDVIDTIMSGRSGLAMMATSAGKTLCFVLPALLSDGVTVAVFPTLSLIRDMAGRISQLCSTAILTGSTPDRDRDRLFSNLSQGTSGIKIVLTTPESLRDSNFVAALKKSKLSRFIIDEAHCVDRWGKQFRPDYLDLKDLFNRVGSCQVVALTGTATEETKTAIVSNLGLSEPFLYKMSFNRSNLNFSVVPKGTSSSAQDYLVNLLNTYKDKSCIVYCMTPADCNAICAALISSGIPCVSYHGQLAPFEKLENQTKWQTDDVNVIVATKALGMGIDKPNVRLVVHYTVPASIDDYYQEAGRAGRDDGPADCILMFKLEDRAIHLDHITKCRDISVQRNFLHELQAVLNYSTSLMCRKVFILNYYSEQSVTACKTCDMCVSSKQTMEVDYTTDAVNIVLLLQGLTPVLGQVPYTTLVKVFKGSKDKEILAKRLHDIPLYGCGKSFLIKEASLFILTLVIRKVLSENVTSNGRSTHITPGENSPLILKNQYEVKCKVLSKSK